MKKVLLVDDDKDVLELLVAILEDKAGCHSTLAYNAEEALRVLKDQEFDLLIVDNHMGNGMKGIDLIKLLSKKGIKTPVYLHTSDPRIEFMYEDTYSKFNEEMLRKASIILSGD